MQINLDSKEQVGTKQTRKQERKLKQTQPNLCRLFKNTNWEQI